MGLVILPVILCASPVPPDRIADRGLTPEQEKGVRSAVYDHGPKTASPKMDFTSILIIPEPLAELYQSHPESVIKSLLQIIEGGRPIDSATAAGYAFELLGGPGRGVVCVEYFDAKAYDTVQKGWEKTYRKHWIGKVLALQKEGSNKSREK